MVDLLFVSLAVLSVASVGATIGSSIKVPLPEKWVWFLGVS
jgi:hypothetical protein